MKCQSCGAAAADTAKFCEYCGTKLIRESEQPASTAVPVVPAEQVEQIPEEPINVTESPEAVPAEEPPEAEIHTAQAVPAELPADTVPEDTTREQAYLDYEKKLRDMRKQQTETAIAAVAVAETAEEIPVQLPAESPSEPTAAEVVQLPNAVVLAGRSGIFGAANVMFTINTVLTAIASVVTVLLFAGGAVAAISALSEFFGINVYDYIGVLGSSALPIMIISGIIAAVFINIPLILINIGVCSTRSACKNSDGGSIRPTGLKLIRVIAVIGLILTALVCATGLVISVIFILGDSYTHSFGVTLLTFSAIFTVIMAFCFAKLMDTLNRAIDAAEGYYEKKASTFLGILCIIMAVFLLVNLPACLALIFYAVTLFKYNSIVGSRSR